MVFTIRGNFYWWIWRVSVGLGYPHESPLSADDVCLLWIWRHAKIRQGVQSFSLCFFCFLKTGKLYFCFIFFPFKRVAKDRFKYFSRQNTQTPIFMDPSTRWKMEFNSLNMNKLYIPINRLNQMRYLIFCTFSLFFMIFL